jgi:hypothetical protein
MIVDLIFIRYCIVQTVEINPKNASRYQLLSVQIVIPSIWHVYTDAAVFQDPFNFKTRTLHNTVTSKRPSSTIIHNSG